MLKLEILLEYKPFSFPSICLTLMIWEGGCTDPLCGSCESSQDCGVPHIVLACTTLLNIKLILGQVWYVTQ